VKGILLKVSDHTDRFIHRIGLSVSWLTLIMVILICMDVFLRYLLSSTKTWIIELEWHLFSVLFLLGLSYTFQHQKHVRVDLFYEKMSKKYRNLVDTVSILLFLIPWCIIVIHTSFDYAMNSWSFRETSPQPNGLPARYIIKFFISTGFVLLLIQGVSSLIRIIYGPNED
jgi:TRAP-type mannitol/chloroaromatic compound transport system permease small subunit